MKELLLKISEKSPLVHNITNFVVMNNTANALLAIGASPVMAHATEEVEEMVAISSALVINVGTLSPRWVDAMEVAMVRAKKLGVPIVYDPVGAGATSYRNQVNARLLQAAAPDVIRGNGSEIMALAQSGGIKTKGVDSTASSDSAINAARMLSEQLGSVVVISGQTDYIVSGGCTLENKFGTPLMTAVTGMGCTATAICGAFAAVERDFARAAQAAMELMGRAGEAALAKTNSPASFQIAFIDSLYELRTEKDDF